MAINSPGGFVPSPSAGAAQLAGYGRKQRQGPENRAGRPLAEALRPSGAAAPSLAPSFGMPFSRGFSPGSAGGFPPLQARPTGASFAANLRPQETADLPFARHGVQQQTYRPPPRYQPPPDGSGWDREKDRAIEKGERPVGGPPRQIDPGGATPWWKDMFSREGDRAWDKTTSPAGAPPKQQAPEYGRQPSGIAEQDFQTIPGVSSEDLVKYDPYAQQEKQRGNVEGITARELFEKSAEAGGFRDRGGWGQPDADRLPGGEGGGTPFGDVAAQLMGLAGQDFGKLAGEMTEEDMARFMENFQGQMDQYTDIGDTGRGLYSPEALAEQERLAREGLRSGVGQQRDEALRMQEARAGRGGAVGAGGYQGIQQAAMQAMQEGERGLAQDAFGRKIGATQTGTGIERGALDQQMEHLLDQFTGNKELLALLLGGINPMSGLTNALLGG